MNNWSVVHKHTFHCFGMHLSLKTHLIESEREKARQEWYVCTAVAFAAACIEHEKSREPEVRGQTQTQLKSIEWVRRKGLNLFSCLRVNSRVELNIQLLLTLSLEVWPTWEEKKRREENISCETKIKKVRSLFLPRKNGWFCCPFLSAFLSIHVKRFTCACLPVRRKETGRKRGE